MATETRAAQTLQQKLVEIRKAIPALSQKAYSDGVKYKFLKVSDIYEYLTPAMNEQRVNFDIVDEKATRHAENGDDVYYHSYQQSTRAGQRTVWVYEADLTLRWTNADDPADFQEAKIHAIGCNDGSPDKAKGSALTYAIKYMLFNKFSVDQGEDDPDNADRRGDAPQYGQNQGKMAMYDSGRVNTQAGPQNGQNGQTDGKRRLSDAQMTRLYRKGEAAGYSNTAVDAWICKKYSQDDPRYMTSAQYEEACAILDENAKQGGATNE